MAVSLNVGKWAGEKEEKMQQLKTWVVGNPWMSDSFTSSSASVWLTFVNEWKPYLHSPRYYRSVEVWKKLKPCSYGLLLFPSIWTDSIKWLDNLNCYGKSVGNQDLLRPEVVQKEGLMAVEGFKYQLESLSYRQGRRKINWLLWGLYITIPSSDLWKDSFMSFMKVIPL